MDTRNNIIHQRPTGVSILATLQLINSVIGLFMGFVIILFTNPVVQWVVKNGKTQIQEQQLPVITRIAIVLGIFVLAMSLFRLLLAYGLFTLKGWAWIITLFFNGLSAIGNFYLIFSQKSGFSVFSLLIDVVIIYYLLRPNVKRAFGKA